MITSGTEPTSRDRALRQAFSLYPTGVVALAAQVGGLPVGMAVNSFTSISLEPTLVAIGAARTSKTWPLLRDVPELGMSVLASNQEVFSRRLASHQDDRFGDQVRETTVGGAVLIGGAALWLTCRPHATYDGGDHEIALFEIVDITVFDGVEPLVFHQSRYRNILSDPQS